MKKLTIEYSHEKKTGDILYLWVHLCIGGARHLCCYVKEDNITYCSKNGSPVPGTERDNVWVWAGGSEEPEFSDKMHVAFYLIKGNSALDQCRKTKKAVTISEIF